MRSRRLKMVGQAACYHVMSRMCEEVPYLDEVAKEVLRKQMWKTARFCSVDVLSYCIMGNHFHILVRVPEKVELSDDELLERYRSLYGKPTAYQTMDSEVLAANLREGGEAREKARERLLSRMGDLSSFMKLLKQRFSIWYNKSHRRRGTLWGERFKSVLVESSVEALATVAAYIDLNPVRAGLVEDPQDYRFCGYAEWMSGKAAMQAGYRRIFGEGELEQCLAHYRVILFGKGGEVKRADGSGATLEPKKVRAIVQAGGKVEKSELLRCRIRYFSDGCLIGSKGFLETVAMQARESGLTLRRNLGSVPMNGFETQGLRSFRRLRGPVIS